MTSPSRFVPTPTGYLMVLTEGDDVLGNLERLARDCDIGAATFTGFGFVRTVTFGFFDFSARQYKPATFEACELASMTGTIAWKDDAPSIHAHGVACDAAFASHGGHLLALEVGTGSVEIAVVVAGHGDRRLVRTVDPSIGANILRLDET
ncbi:DNA-binding protein [Luteibacter aegosomaticola]|uniref:PPC domain-containing DNA-binding protein n=1 Tax=Luteibacter aegosomaticola TaxID=2911538 RepID=UPI001FFC089E|nr:PPC domain-containing DNA-binding protein [Luteibacter aegosomaticola]UPG88190.1 DNA-binding protein [Luteibacter aegosomaticola]